MENLESVASKKSDKVIVIKEAQNLLVEHKSLEYIREQLGNPLFLVVSGSHMFGFPSKNSDIDIRGVFITPTAELLGLDKTKETYRIEEGKLDLSICELGHYLKHVAKSNGNYLEWVNSPYLIHTSEDFVDLKNIVNSSISKEIYDYHSHFAKDLWDSAVKTKEVKEFLYAFRIYMAGINLLRDCEVRANINKLNKKFRIPIIGELINYKKSEEHIKYPKSLAHIESELRKLSEILDQEHKNSRLPSMPDKIRINNYLIKLRKKYFNQNV